MPCISTKIGSFGGAYRLHLQGQTIPSKLRMLSAGLFLALPFNPEYEGDMLIRDTGIPPNYAVLQSPLQEPKIQLIIT
jgi:hypothetical protein